jgi:hypothetical protein
MKLFLTRDIYVCGKSHKAGDIVDVDEPHVGHLFSAAAARRPSAQELAPETAAAAVETATAAPAAEQAVSRKARR